MTTRITAREVGLEVPVYLQSDRSSKTWFATLLGAAVDKPRREFRTLLDDVSFELNDGDRLAIIGRNGAGKSTLLRLLTGAFMPTRGSIESVGSCQALLNISLGFNGEATVKENVFLRGTAMGIRSAQLRELLDPILDFAGLRDKATHRLKTLSAGQRLRLGFAISTSVQNDIMLMDEWIGAGDAEFLVKARERMVGRVNGSRIVVLASHNVHLVRDVCNLGIVLEQGRVVYFGEVKDALNEYTGLIRRSAANH